MTELVVIRCPECGTKAGSISEQDDGSLTIAGKNPKEFGRQVERWETTYETTGGAAMVCPRCRTLVGTPSGGAARELHSARRTGRRRNVTGTAT